MKHKRFNITTKKVEFTIICGWYPTSTFVLFDIGLLHWAGEHSKAFEVGLISLFIAKFHFSIFMGTPIERNEEHYLKMCETCKHKKVSGDVEPCNSCQGFNKWEPKPKQKLFRAKSEAK